MFSIMSRSCSTIQKEETACCCLPVTLASLWNPVQDIVLVQVAVAQKVMECIQSFGKFLSDLIFCSAA